MTVQKGGWDFFQEGKAAMGDASGNAVTDSSGNPAATSVVSEITNGWGYGNYPETWYQTGAWDGAADTETTTITGTEAYNTFTLELHTLTATSLTVSVSIDGTNFSNAMLVDLSDGAVFGAVAINATGIYRLFNMKFSDIKLTQAGAGAAEVRWSLGNT